MKGMFLKFVTVCLMVFLLPAASVHANEQGTDGTELQIAKPEQLEIHLGEDFAGVEFTLELEYGMYPGTVKVGQDGVLRLEIGGSSKYVLCALESIVQEDEAPVPESVPVTTLALPEIPSESIVPEDVTPTDPQIVWHRRTVAGIPITHLIFFALGLTLAAGVLFFGGRRRVYTDDDYEDGF